MFDNKIKRCLNKISEMPNEHPAKALFVAFNIALFCALIVSTAAVLLEPLQRANRERDRQQQILEIINRLPGSGELLSAVGKASVRTEIIELATGNTVRSIDPAAYDQRKAATDPQQSITIPAEHDIAGIGRRAKFAPVTLVEQDGKITMVILPVHGSGYASTIYGFLALRGDGNTVVALSFFEHAETPGLGAELNSAEWLAKWPGKTVSDETGRVKIAVVKGRVELDSPDAAFEVDGISGATRTGNGVTNMMRYWLSDHGFGQFLDRIAS